MDNFDTNATYFESHQQYHPTSADLSKVLYQDHNLLKGLATEYKRNGDWLGALACLYQVKNELKDEEDHQYLSVALRLALYLQAARKFEEAKFELQSLLDELDYIAEYQCKYHENELALHLDFCRYNTLSLVFDTARKIYQREKQYKDADNFAAKAKYFRKIATENSELLHKQRQIRLDELREELNRDREERRIEREQTALKKKQIFWWSIAIGLAIVQAVKYFTK